MTDETKPTKEETLGELRKQVKELEKQLAAKESEVDSMKKKEEGWLVWTPSAIYQGQTMHVTFNDGMAFIKKDLKYPEGSAEYVVNQLVTDFGYKAQFFTKDQMDELQQKISQRAMERKEVEAKFGTQAEMMEKLLEAHRM
jgi:hypothetical protein